MKYDHHFSLAQAGPSMRVYESDGITMRIDFFEDMLRFALLVNDEPLLPTWSVCPDCGEVPLYGRDRLSTEGFVLAEPEVIESEDRVSFTLAGVQFIIEKKNFRVTALTERGVLYRDRSGAAYNFDGELGSGSAHYTDRFESQRVYGLGDKGGSVDKSGRRFMISATDSMGFRTAGPAPNDPLYKHIPFFICEHDAGSYGIYYDTYSRGSMDFGARHDNYFEPFQSACFEEENMVFYLMPGTTAGIVRAFTKLCGGAVKVPEWALRYCGSTMEYTDAPDADARLRGFLERCEAEGTDASGFYLSSGYTQTGERRYVFNWNKDKIHSPEGLSADFERRGVHLIPNVKPAFLDDHPMYEMIARNGWFLHYADGTPALFPFWGGMASYLDFTEPGAYAFWKECVKEHLIEKGYRHIWNDNNEYDISDSDVLANGFGDPVRAARICPLFSYLMARASREACLEAGVNEPFNISRCAMAGTQRVASTWTGDNHTDFSELRGNHRQAMTMALTGFLFFGPDIGGFWGPKPGRELFMRWLQYGVFMPRFVLHSWKPGEESTMPWLYPDMMPAVKRLFELRESLVPYLYGQAERARADFMPLIRPVFLYDPSYGCESDFFMCGDDILACPVFDEGAESVTVTLPAAASEECGGHGTGWKLRGEGEIYKKGETLTVKCLPEDLPVWFVKSYIEELN